MRKIIEEDLIKIQGGGIGTGAVTGFLVGGIGAFTCMLHYIIMGAAMRPLNIQDIAEITAYVALPALAGGGIGFGVDTLIEYSHSH